MHIYIYTFTLPKDTRDTNPYTVPFLYIMNRRSNPIMLRGKSAAICRDVNNKKRTQLDMANLLLPGGENS